MTGGLQWKNLDKWLGDLILKIIPYGRQCIEDDDIQAVVDVLKSDWLTTGPKIAEFEKALAKKVGAKHVVVFSSGTAALHAAYFAAGVREGDEVITSPITFAATANAALYLGAKPVFVDVDRDTININSSLIKAAVTERTKVIAPVDFAGHPADLDLVMEIAEEYNLVVVEDAAHSLGAVYKGRTVGSIAHMTIFSFHPVKHITTGEGGAVATDNPDFYEKLLNFRSHGIVKDNDKLFEYYGLWYQEMQQLGFNYRLTDLQCALGLSQLKKLDRFLIRRQELVELYNRLLSELDIVQLPVVRDDVIPAWHLYYIRLLDKPDLRKNVFDELRNRGIGVQVHYIPVYWHPYYRALGYQKGLCPEAEAYYQSCISLPLFPGLTNKEVEKVVDELNLAVKKYYRG